MVDVGSKVEMVCIVCVVGSIFMKLEILVLICLGLVKKGDVFGIV